jgi:hypothetical protein
MHENDDDFRTPSLCRLLLKTLPDWPLSFQRMFAGGLSSRLTGFGVTLPFNAQPSCAVGFAAFSIVFV